MFLGNWYYPNIECNQRLSNEYGKYGFDDQSNWLIVDEFDWSDLYYRRYCQMDYSAWWIKEEDGYFKLISNCI